MDAKKLQSLRKALEKRKAEIEGDVSYMEDEMRAIGVDQDEENGSLGNHIADDGSNVAEAERIATVSEDMDVILHQINAALERMDEGTYGTCARCGKQIAAARLNAFPYVAYCIDCQTALENQQQLRVGA